MPKHESETFVDDTFHCIRFDPTDKIKSYLEKFYELIHSYHEVNLLKINPDKTQLMFVSKPKYKPLTKHLTFKAKSYEIKPVLCLKVLGSFISHDLDNEREISQLIPLLNYRINQFEKLKSYTDFKTRLQFANSFIIGRMTYMMPTYTNLSCHQKDRLHKVLMQTARMALNSYCLGKSIEFILSKYNWVDINEMIKLSSLKFINNLLLSQKPWTLYYKLN